MERMDLKEIKVTPVWKLLERGENYHRRTGIYTDTDKNYRFYNDDQWSGAKLGDVEPIQNNFIKPIVKYKLAVIHANLYSIVFRSMNYEDPVFRHEAGRYCNILNGYAEKVWELGKLDLLCRKMTKDAAINSEGIMHVFFDKESGMPVCEVIDKCDVYYGDENNENLQEQPYILIRRRMDVAAAVEFAKARGVTGTKLDLIVGDNDNAEEAGDAAKEELDGKCYVVYKYYKDAGSVKCDIATKHVEIRTGMELGISLYPIAHMVWESAKGSARGAGEVKTLIPSQIEVNRIAIRRAIVVKSEAYPRTVVNTRYVENPDDIDRVGSVIEIDSQSADDVNKIIAILKPAQISSDVKLLQDDLIALSRELAGAGEAATGQIDPASSNVSGKAIIAIQSAAQAPMTEQKEAFKFFIEDLANIWLEFLIANSEDGINLEETVPENKTGEEEIQLVKINAEILRRLKARVRIDITPKSPYDKFALEQTIENLLTSGLLSSQRVAELEIYANLLDDDSVAPKQKILEAVAMIRKKMAEMAQIQSQAEILEAGAQRYLGGDPISQAQQRNAARQRAMQRAAVTNQ